jgi:hypothetical protein
LAKALADTVFKELKITENISSITCDNASNNGSMIRTLDEEYDAFSSKLGALEEDNKVATEHLRCTAHVWNLACAAFGTCIVDDVTSVRDCVKLVKISQETRREFKIA